MIAFLTGIIRIGLVEVFGKTLPVLTISYNITMSIINPIRLLISHQTDLPLTLSAPPKYENVTSRDFSYVLEGTIKGVGQFFFCTNYTGSFIIVFSILLCRRLDGLGALLGSFVAAFTAMYILLIPLEDVPNLREGLWSYNGSGCGVVFFSGCFSRRTKYNAVYGLLAGAATALTEAFLRNLMGPDPVLTLPFVMTTWVFLLARFASEEGTTGRKGNSVYGMSLLKH